MDYLFDILGRFTPVSAGAREDISLRIRRLELPKGQLLARQGQVCQYMYLLRHGLARGYVVPDGKEVTTWFGYENDMITSLRSFITQTPGAEFIELLENSILYQISYDNLQHLYRTFPEFNRIGRLMTERYYIELEQRIFSLQFETAPERYKNLLEFRPELLQRAALGHIASYLGISQETLSRIRAKK